MSEEESGWSICFHRSLIADGRCSVTPTSLLYSLTAVMDCVLSNLQREIKPFSLNVFLSGVYHSNKEGNSCVLVEVYYVFLQKVFIFFKERQKEIVE